MAEDIVAWGKGRRDGEIILEVVAYQVVGSPYSGVRSGDQAGGIKLEEGQRARVGDVGTVSLVALCHVIENWTMMGSRPGAPNKRDLAASGYRGRCQTGLARFVAGNVGCAIGVRCDVSLVGGIVEPSDRGGRRRRVLP